MKNKIYILRNKRGRRIAGKCQFPFCCNFYSLERNTRKYCRFHKIPVSTTGRVISREYRKFDNWIITKTITVRKIKNWEK